jgi:RNA polymerase sigma factor (sigma-70 family)
VGRGTSGLLEVAPTLSSREGDGPDDHALVARVRRGDDRAFESLYGRYHRRIHAYVLGMCKDHARAEDITQEVFVSALRRMRETERPIAFKPWVYEIAKNACIDHFRRSRRAEEVSLEADDALAPADYGRLVGAGPTPEAAVVVKQDLDNLCGAFGGLSDVHHEILVMRELEGLSYREIGERLGMSRPAVESTLFRARRRLGEEYDELVSGERCLRIGGIIASASRGRIGTRAARQLTRHVAHCQGCRREALEAGLDPATLRRPLRKRVAAKVAGVLPFPILRRGGGHADPSPGWVAHLASLSDQIGPGWSKAAAAAAVLLAGLGAGAGTKVIAETGHAKQRPAAAADARTAPARPAPARHSTRGASAAPAVSSARHPARLEPAARRSGREIAKVTAEGTERSSAAASTPREGPSAASGGRSDSSAPPTTSSRAGDAVRQVANAPKAAATPVAAPAPAAARPVADAVEQVANATTQAAADTATQAVGTATRAIGATTEAARSVLTPATQAVDRATDGATAPVTSAVRGATRDVTGAVDALAG